MVRLEEPLRKRPAGARNRENHLILCDRKFKNGMASNSEKKLRILLIIHNQLR